MIRLLACLVMAWSWESLSGQTNTNPNTPTRPVEEVVEIQGIKIWKRGTPASPYVALGNESLNQITWPEAQSRIARGVRARRGNAAIVNSMVPSQRSDITRNTGINQLDSQNVRYTIIQLKP